MRTVYATLKKLEVISVCVNAKHNSVFVNTFKERKLRKYWLLIARADVSPDQTASFVHRVRGCFQFFRKAFICMIRRIHNGPIYSKFPAVVKAADSAALDTTDCERNTSVHAVLVQHPHFTPGITEDYKVFAEKFGTKRVTVWVR